MLFKPWNLKNLIYRGFPMKREGRKMPFKKLCIGAAALAVLLMTVSVTPFLFSKEMEQEKQPDEQAEKAADKTGISAGMRVNYFWWSPDFTIKKSVDAIRYPFMISVSHPDPGMKTGMESGFLYNPVFNVRLGGEWSVSGSFTYGEFSAIKNAAYYEVFAPNPDMSFNRIIRCRVTLKKYDADLLFGRRLGGMFRIFFGPKYNGISQTSASLTLLQELYVTGNYVLPLPSKGYLKSHNGGLGMGGGMTLPLFFDFYLLSNISFIGMLGNNVGTKDLSAKDYKKMVVSVGGSGSASIARYINRINATIEAGFKFQYLSYVNVRVGNRRPYDFYYGVFFGAVYNF